MIDSLRPLIRLAMPVVLALSLTTPVMAQSSKCNAETDYLSRAQSSIEEGQYLSAIEAYTCSIQLDAENYDAYLGRATATILTAAIRGEVGFNVTPDLNLVYYNAYDLITTAIADATAAINTNPEDVEAHAIRGYLYWYTGQNQNALIDFDAILRVDDGNTYAYLFRGAANQYLGNEAKAENDFRVAAETTAEPAGVYGQVGAFYANTGDPERGIEYYSMAIDLEPDNALLYTYRAYTYETLDDYESAIADYTSAIAIDPNNANYYLSRAWQYEQLEDYPSATADYTSAIAIAPDDASAIGYRGWVYIAMGDFNAAAADFEAAIALDDTDRWAFLGQGTALAALEQITASAQAFQQYIALMESYRTDANPLKPGNSQSLEVTEGQVYAVPVNAEAGTTLDITATAQTGDVDPMILLLDTAGLPAAGSDDITEGDLNAAIRNFEVPQNGRYTLLVTHAGGGNSGAIEVSILQTNGAALPQPTAVASTACTADAAQSLQAAGDHEAAVNAYICAVEANPNDDALLLQRGLAGLMLEPNRPALDAINEVDSMAPDLVDAEIENLTRTLNAEPGHLTALTARAYLHWYRALDDEAIADFDAILALDPTNAFAHLYRGSSYQYLGQTAEAEQDFESALASYSENIAALQVIIYSYLDTEDDENAVRYLDIALSADPSRVNLLSERAHALANLGDMEAAVTDMQSVLTLEPDVAYHYNDLGWIFLRAARYAEAETTFTDALSMDSTLLFSLLGRGTAKSELGNLAEGAADYATYLDLIEFDRFDVQLVNNRASLAMEEGYIYAIPVILTAGQTIEVIVESPDFSVDPLLLITDASGTPLVGNDDADMIGGVFDSVLTFTAPQAGSYELVVTHASAGSYGDVEVTVNGLGTPAATATPAK